MTKTPSLTWQSGDILLNQYEVKNILGQGGMGIVYQVHHRGWDLDLAVKCPKAELFTKVGGKEDFFREAETWVNLSLHPHIVSCYYVRLLEEIPCIFAEYVSGGSLADWIKQRRLSQGGDENTLERMLDIAIQFAWGLHAAHSQGLVHQDVKPANVMMSLEGIVKVTDFGLAKVRAMGGGETLLARGGTQSILVSAGGMTPAYCSPEQYARQSLGRKTDIWGWAVSILQMFVGGVTWLVGPVAGEALTAYLRRGPVDPHLPAMPAGLAALLRHCFQLRPENRPTTMREVAEALQEIYTHEIGHAYPRQMPQPARMLADTLNNRALSFYDLGKVEEALRVWEQALHVDPQHLEATYNRGVVLWRQGAMTDEMLLHQLEIAKVAQNSYGQAETLLLQVHLERGTAGKALPLLEEVASLAGSQGEGQKLSQLAQEAARTNHLDPLIIQVSDSIRVEHVNMSANGSFLVSGGRDTTVRLWEVSTGRCLRIFRGHTDMVHSVSLSADGGFLASGGRDTTVRLWEVSTGRCLHILQGHTGGVTSVSLNADGSFLASAGSDGTVRLWETSTGHCLHILQGHTDRVTSVSLSANGSFLASGGRDKTVRLWEVSTGRCLHILQGHTGGVTSVSLSADGSFLASAGGNPLVFEIESGDETVRLWEVSTGRCLRIFQGHTDRVHSVSLSADGSFLASVDTQATVRLWEVSSSRCLRTFRDHMHLTIGFAYFSVSLSADGNFLVSWDGENKVYLWKCHDSGFRCTFSLSRIHSHVAVTQTEHHAISLIKQAEHAYRENHVAGALDLLRQLRTLPGWERHPQSLEMWKKLALVCSRKKFHASRLARIIPASEEAIYSVSLSADGNFLASGGRDKTVRLWEVSTGRCLRIFRGHTELVHSVSLSADGGFLASGSRDKSESNDEDETVIYLWETSTGRCLHILRHYTGEVPMSLSADGRFLASGDGDETVRLWEVSTGRCLRTFQDHFAQVHSVSLSADGSFLASVDTQATVRLWEVSTGHCLRIFRGHTRQVYLVSLSVDGRFLASAGEDKIQLWETSTGHCLHILQGHSGGVISMSLNADGSFLASAGSDGTVRLWETSTGHCLHILQGHTGGVTSVSLSPDGNVLVSGGLDNTIHLYELDWELEVHDPANWDEGARPYLEIFLAQHIPYASELPQDREPTEQEIQQALTREGTPTWNEEDFQGLIHQLQHVGYGWLRTEGVRQQLEQMVQEWYKKPGALVNFLIR